MRASCDVNELQQLIVTLPAELVGRLQVGPVRDLRTQASMTAAEGWIVTLQAGDLLSADALVHFAVAAARTGSDFLYADERRYDEQSSAVRPFFKPGWSPETLLAFNYVGSTVAISAVLARQCFSTLADFIDSSPYDRALRLTELATHPVRVARLLSEHLRLNAEPAPTQEEALIAALARRSETAQVVPGLVSGAFYSAAIHEMRR